MASGMDMSEQWIILCVLCWISLIESQTVSIVENKTDWFTAFRTCKMLNGRLPGATISNNQLQLQDVSGTKNISSSFWIAATYDFLDVNVSEPHYDYSYPYACCERMTIASRKQQIECGDCSVRNTVICATSNDKIYVRETIRETDWHCALQECTKRNIFLPKRENAELLERAQRIPGYIWLDGIRQINLTPDIGIQNRTCLHSVIGSIQEVNCYDPSMTTVCIFETKYIVSTSKPTNSMESQTIINGTIATSPSRQASFETSTNMATDPLMVSSEEKFTTDMTTPREVHTTDTTSSMFPSQAVHTTGMSATAEDSTTNKQVLTLSTHLSDTSYSNMLNSSSKLSEKTLETPSKGIWPILGGALGASVVIIIVVIVIIILLRRYRMKNGQDTIKNSTTNNKPTIRIPPQTSISYDIVPGESFALEAHNATSLQESTAQEEEPVIYAQPQKVKTNCRNLMDDQFNITQMTDEKGNTGLYSIVQKRQKGHGISNNLYKDEVLNMDYSDVSIMESGKDEALENVYNKNNFSHPGLDEVHTDNVYDKANFRHEVLETDTEKGKFHRPESSNFDTTYMMNFTTDSTYDRLK